MGRFRPVPEIEARVSERGSISSSFRNLEGLSWEGVAFSVCQKSRHRSGEGAQFGHVSGISDIVPAIWSIPQCFSRGGERLGEGLISRSFQKKSGGWEGCRLDCWTLRKNVAKALHVLGERVEREWI